MICADSGEDEEESPALPVVAITTLQKSSKFKNLFNQLRLTVKERRIATKALVSITSRTGIKCLVVEVTYNRAFLQESSEITFSDEDMEVGYSNHRRPLYLAVFINQIPIKRALVDIGAFCKPHRTKHFTSSGNLKKEDSGMPNGSDRVYGKRQIHHRPHPTVVKGGPHSLSSSLPYGENGSLKSCASGEAIVAQASISPIHLSSVRERNVEWQNDTHSSKSIII